MALRRERLNKGRGGGAKTENKIGPLAWEKKAFQKESLKDYFLF